jgi:predicted kinase
MTLTVYAMCGLAFSGKSSAAAAVVRALKIDVASLDGINIERGLKGGEGIADAQWEETSFIAMERVRAFLKSVRSLVVDDTFSHRFLRDRCKAVADEFSARFVILFMDTPLAEIEVRRAANNLNPVRHGIRDAVFAHHRDRFQFPTDDEPVVRIRTNRELADWLARQLGG